MEFLEPKKERDNFKPILPKREYAKEDNDKFFDDVEDMADAKDARQYKQHAQTAMNKEAALGENIFRTTLNRWLAENELRAAMKEGLWSPPEKELEIDWGKVSYTFATQLASLAMAILCIKVGLWPVILFTVPFFFAINFNWLLNDREG